MCQCSVALSSIPPLPDFFFHSINLSPSFSLLIISCFLPLSFPFIFFYTILSPSSLIPLFLFSFFYSYISFNSFPSLTSLHIFLSSLYQPPLPLSLSFSLLLPPSFFFSLLFSLSSPFTSLSLLILSPLLICFISFSIIFLSTPSLHLFLYPSLPSSLTPFFPFLSPPLLLSFFLCLFLLLQITTSTDL
ncbi:hypothetical protein NQD34_013693 [Periophthalmus magnuspinnatus]|nr:hypothetical protein NQD34_013693 [Periophthalmus magnuspinnatus]